MEDFIYLIALIAWVVFALYRRSQKKAEQARTSAGQTRSEDQSRPLPTLEEILLGEEHGYEHDEEPLPPRTVYKAPVIPAYSETAFEKEYNLRGITSIEELDKPIKLQPVVEEEIQVEELSGAVADFDPQRIRKDIRQAVIYSEILNRPYD